MTAERLLKQLFEDVAGSRPRWKDSIPAADGETLWSCRMAQAADGDRRKVPVIGLVEHQGRTISLYLWRNEHEARLAGAVPENDLRLTGYRGAVIRAGDVCSNPATNVLVEIGNCFQAKDFPEMAWALGNFFVSLHAIQMTLPAPVGK